MERERSQPFILQIAPLNKKLFSSQALPRKHLGHLVLEHVEGRGWWSMWTSAAAPVRSPHQVLPGLSQNALAMLRSQAKWPNGLKLKGDPALPPTIIIIIIIIDTYPKHYYSGERENRKRVMLSRSSPCSITSLKTQWMARELQRERERERERELASD